jgi:hypothetical protein
MAGTYPRDRASIDFRPAFTGDGGDLDHEGPTRKAYLTDTYGLVIHTSVISNMAPKWTVSHTRSGYAIGYAPTWQAALTLAAKLGECGTWNRDLSEIEADTTFRLAASDIIRAHGAPRAPRLKASVWG